MRDLPFEQLADRTLRIGALFFVPGLVLLVLNYAVPIAYGLLIGVGTGVWNAYFMVRRLKLADPKDKFFQQKLQKNLLIGLVLRLFTIIAALLIAVKISLAAAVAAGAGIFAVCGVFAAMAAGALLKETKAGQALRYKLNKRG